MAAAAGEFAKDEKHLAAVMKMGEDFIPLVMETFGVWTLFTLQSLNISMPTEPPPVVVFLPSWQEKIYSGNCLLAVLNVWRPPANMRNAMLLGHIILMIWLCIRN